MGDEIILLGCGFSPFGMRVRVTLAEKGIQYKYREENLDHKSPLLLASNPVHQKIPVLIHNGKPISESLIIVQYIDETWRGTSPLMPKDPYSRASAMFWAEFIDKKVYESGSRIWRSKGDAQKAAKKDFIDCLKLLEVELGEKPYFGGYSLGFVDVALIPFACSWFYTYETFGNFNVEETCSQLMAWAKRCMERESISKVLPNPHEVYDGVVEYANKKFGF
eukprot:TRINITY_DN4812_c0_g1_i3.p1 TRINITY_DN4812_c0_g1~~TRINITY_DN4812_c0_g1_i3.p1  ORF type:complete len:221 (+),score=43.86 TRINITY_DN4812_c0_g1_i3:319-981(+)